MFHIFNFNFLQVRHNFRCELPGGKEGESKSSCLCTALSMCVVLHLHARAHTSVLWTFSIIHSFLLIMIMINNKTLQFSNHSSNSVSSLLLNSFCCWLPIVFPLTRLHSNGNKSGGWGVNGCVYVRVSSEQWTSIRNLVRICSFSGL